MKKAPLAMTDQDYLDTNSKPDDLLKANSGKCLADILLLEEIDDYITKSKISFVESVSLTDISQNYNHIQHYKRFISNLIFLKSINKLSKRFEADIGRIQKDFLVFLQLAKNVEFGLTNQRLLRKHTLECVDDIFQLIKTNRKQIAMCGDTTLAKYNDKNELSISIEFPDNPLVLEFGILDKDQLVGTISLTPETRNSRVQIGYYLGKEFEGNGYMREAVQYIVKFVFSYLGFNEVYAYVHEENRKSQSVLLNSGFKFFPEKNRKSKDTVLLSIITEY